MEPFKIVFEADGFKGEFTLSKIMDIYGIKRPVLDYKIETPTGVKISGDEFVPSYGTKWYDPKAIFELLFWMTLTPDSGADFDGYTLEQMDWFKSELCYNLGSIYGDENYANDLEFNVQLSTEDWDAYTFGEEGDTHVIKIRRETIEDWFKE